VFRDTALKRAWASPIRRGVTDLQPERDREPWHGSGGYWALGLVVAVLLLAAACFASYVAFVAKGLSCVNTSAHEPEDCRRHASVQLIVAAAGLAPAAALVVAAVRRSRTLAAVALVVGASTYVVWGFLLDAMLD
jgi:hypothetical protein